MKLEDKRVYISGPVTGYDRDRTVARFASASAMCYRHGASYVFDPTVAVADGTPHDKAMCRCLNELTMWDFDTDSPYYGVLMQLDGWEDSDGARMECAVAQACGIERMGIWEVR